MNLRRRKIRDNIRGHDTAWWNGIAHSVRFADNEEMERIVNRNPRLYGPGPLARKAVGLGAKPPLQGLVICAGQAIVFGLAGGLVYSTLFGNPGLKQIEEYYKENPPH